MNFHFVSLLERTPWGGCEELWSQTALHLARAGHRVSASVKWWPAAQRHPRLSQLSGAGITLSERKPPSGGWSRFLRKSVRKPTVDFAIRNCDLAIFSSTGNRFPLSGIQQCTARGVSYALIIQAVSESEWPRDAELDAWREIYAGAAAAFFVSHANLESTSLQVGLRRNEFRVVSNPYNVPREMEFSWPPENSLTRMAFIGRLEPEHKGLDLLFRALARERWRERSLVVNIHGDGLAGRSVRRMAEMLQLNELVKFHGFASSILEVWRENELLLMPSRHEGLPLAVVEAMMCGRPCLVTNVSGNPEHVEHGRTGFIAAGATVDAVDEALEKAWNVRDQWEAMGRNAHAAIRARVPEEPIASFAGELVALLERVTKTKS